jgi:homocysteine S-methyltransferase
MAAMSHFLLEQLQRGPLLCDGAMGTLLYSRGITFDACFDALNLTNPDLIQGIHSEYLSAGAQIIETNTFGANRIKLDAHHLGDRTRAINFRAARIALEAREVSGVPAFVAGAVGPSGRPLQAPEAQRLSDIRSIFREQIEALLEGGCELIILETFSNLAELCQAVLAAQEIGGFPLIAQMSFYEDGHTLAGQSACHVATVLNDLGVDIIGANCSVGPAATLDVLKEMIETLHQTDNTHRPLFSAQPNAGLPRRINNRFFYVSTPDYFANYALQFIQAGIHLVGGCCGTTPRHIEAMRQAIDTHYHSHIAYRPSPQSQQGNGDHRPSAGSILQKSPYTPQLIEEKVLLPQEGTRTRLQEKLAAGEFVISIELDPPRGLNPTKLLSGAALLKEAGADCINIADSPMARVRMSCIALARLLHDHLDIDTIIHFTTRDRNLMALQSELMGAHALGIRNVLALTGDPLRVGDYPDATGVWDVDSIGLLRIIRGMTEGHDAAGSSIGARASFHIGCALNLNMTDEETDAEIEKYQHKLAAGADFIMTQPIYDLAPLQRFIQRAGQPPIPLLLGYVLLHSSQHAEYLNNEVPGITIPDSVRARLRNAGDHGHEEGLLLAQELLMQADSMIQGVYLLPSYRRYDIVCELIQSLRLMHTGKVRPG